MSGTGAQEMTARELQQALERLHRDMERVEFWADALGGFSKPVPDYEAAANRLNDFILPTRTGKPERVTNSQDPRKRAYRGAKNSRF